MAKGLILRTRCDAGDYFFRLSALGRAIQFDFEMRFKTRAIIQAQRTEIRAKFAAMLAERFPEAYGPGGIVIPRDSSGPVGFTGSPFDHRAAYARNWPIQAMNAGDYVIGVDLAKDKDVTTVRILKPRA